jgi:hypothetical protein
MRLLYHIHTYLSVNLLQHIVNRSISESSWGKTDSLLMYWAMLPPLVQLALVPAINKLFVPSVHISHAQLPLYNCYTILNTFIHVNIMGVQHDMQTQLTVFLLVLLLDLQAGQLSPDSHVGNS